MFSLFIASPLGFSDAGLLWNKSVLVPALTSQGWKIRDPWSDSFMASHRSADQGKDAHEHAARNLEMMEELDAVIAILDGSDVDSGTAAEVGYAAATGKVVFGLRTDPRGSGEYPGGRVNLQIEHLIARSGGQIGSAGSEIVKLLRAMETAEGPRHVYAPTSLGRLATAEFDARDQ